METALAEHFRYIKYTQLDSDVFTSIVDFDWSQMVEECRRYKQVEGLVEASLYEIQLTLRNFRRIVGLSSSKGITQQVVDAFVLKRSEEVGTNTLNKDIMRLSSDHRTCAQLPNFRECCLRDGMRARISDPSESGPPLRSDNQRRGRC